MKKNTLVALAILTSTSLFAQSERVSLVETFTSSTCNPCNPGNVNLQSILGNGQNDGKYVSLKYQMSWPGTGDPYFTDEGDIRRNFYSVTSIPETFIDSEFGGNPGNMTQNDLNAQYAIAPSAELDAYYQVDEVTQTVTVQVHINALDTVPLGARIYMAVFEYDTYNNVKSNGETEFFHVMKKMLPGATGSVIFPMSAGETDYVEKSHIFQGSYVLPPNATSPVNHASEHSIEEFSDLGVAVWLQNVNNKTIYQATYAQMGYDPLSVEEQMEVLAAAKVYPNPAAQSAAIAFHTTQVEDVTIQVVNAMGQIVHSDLLPNVEIGRSVYELNTQHFPSGMYSVNIVSSSNVLSKKLSVR